MITGLEHGFFIWHNSNGSFTLSQIYGGVSSKNMGPLWRRSAFDFYYGGAPFWATYHVHPGDCPRSTTPWPCHFSVNSGQRDVGFLLP
jgi:hypothetical protein